ncbi:MAG TPA: Ig-like domain-containing protein [Kofleriaceae bacterium]
MTKRLCLALLVSGCSRTGFVAVEIAPQAPVELAAFSHLQLHADGLRADGSREDITDLVRWVSTDRGVATVAETGTLEWAAAGTTHVNVTFYDLRATAALTAADPLQSRRRNTDEIVQRDPRPRGER